MKQDNFLESFLVIRMLNPFVEAKSSWFDHLLLLFLLLTSLELNFNLLTLKSYKYSKCIQSFFRNTYIRKLPGRGREGRFPWPHVLESCIPSWSFIMIINTSKHWSSNRVCPCNKVHRWFSRNERETGERFYLYS